MPNTLEQFPVAAPPPLFQAATALTLTNTLTHLGDPTWQIQATLTVKEPLVVSQPQIEVSLTHA